MRDACECIVDFILKEKNPKYPKIFNDLLTSGIEFSTSDFKEMKAMENSSQVIEFLYNLKNEKQN